MLDYLTLLGDAVDNVPGVYGIGPKTAQNLLAQWGTLDRAVRNAKKLPKGVCKKLTEAKESGQLELSRDLIALDLEVPVNTSRRRCELACREVDKVLLRELCLDLGLKSTLTTINNL